MAGFLFKLETKDGLPAEPSTLSAAVPDWREETRSRSGVAVSLRVLALRDDACGPPVLIVEEAG